MEIRMWRKDKKQLEKEIIQANMNYRAIDEILEMYKRESNTDTRFFNYQKIMQKYDTKDTISPLVEFLKFNKNNIPTELTKVDAEILREITGLKKTDIKHKIGLRKQEKTTGKGKAKLLKEKQQMLDDIQAMDTSEM